MEFKLISTFFTRVFADNKELKRFEVIENPNRSAKVLIYSVTHEGSLQYDFMERRVEFDNLVDASDFVEKETKIFMQKAIDMGPIHVQNQSAYKN